MALSGSIFWLALYGFFRLVWGFFSHLFERNSERKAMKQKALFTLKDGLRERDVAKITSAFDGLRRAKR